MISLAEDVEEDELLVERLLKLFTLLELEEKLLDELPELSLTHPTLSLEEDNEGEDNELRENVDDELREEDEEENEEEELMDSFS